MKIISVIIPTFVFLFFANTGFSQVEPRLANSSIEEPAKENNGEQAATPAPQELAPFAKTTPYEERSEAEIKETTPVLSTSGKNE